MNDPVFVKCPINFVRLVVANLDIYRACIRPEFMHGNYN